MKVSLRTALVLGTALAVPLIGNGTARADTAQDTLSVTATVTSNCTVSGGTLDFGAYATGQAGDHDAETTIGYANCANSLVFELDGGTYGTGETDRKLAPGAGADRLNYQLYRNSSRDAVFGTTANGNAQGVTILGGLPVTGTVSVYGRIPGGQTVPTGAYSDTVNITMTF